ncbi:MAG TPA: GNAT family protein [Rhizomicrobium sp.]
MNSKPLKPITLIVATDDHFAWMLGESDSPDELSLPPDGVDARSTVAMLRSLAAIQRAKRQTGSWLIAVDREVVGLCGYKGVPEHGNAEIGFGIASARRGCGYATQAVAELLIKVATSPEIGSVTAETATGNRASQRVLEKNSFLNVGSRSESADGELIIWLRSAR